MSNSATASAEASSGELVGVSVPVSNATASPSLTAVMGDNSTAQVSGALMISTTTTGTTASATTSGVAAGLIGVGEMDANGTVSPTLDTHIGQNTTIVAGSVALSATHDNGRMQVASATAHSSGGGLVGVNGAVANATASANVDSYVGAGTTINQGVANPTGTVSITA